MLICIIQTGPIPVTLLSHHNGLKFDGISKKLKMSDTLINLITICVKREPRKPLTVPIAKLLQVSSQTTQCRWGGTRSYQFGRKAYVKGMQPAKWTPRVFGTVI